jgi:hypothetical protein
MWQRAGERRITVVRSPKSGVNFLSLGEAFFDLISPCANYWRQCFPAPSSAAGTESLSGRVEIVK